jgi:hypothetical protein
MDARPDRAVAPGMGPDAAASPDGAGPDPAASLRARACARTGAPSAPIGSASPTGAPTRIGMRSPTHPSRVVRAGWTARKAGRVWPRVPSACDGSREPMASPSAPSDTPRRTGRSFARTARRRARVLAGDRPTTRPIAVRRRRSSPALAAKGNAPLSGGSRARRSSSRWGGSADVVRTLQVQAGVATEPRVTRLA